MFKKIVKVFYGTDCLPYKDKELTVHYPITGNSFLGASNSTEIRFYIDKIGDIEDTWVANSKLPNGKMGNYLFQNADKGQDEDGNYLALEVSTFYTQAKGDVYISLNGFYGGVQIDDSGDVPAISGIPTIQATGCIKFSVYYATPLIDGDEVEQITLAQVLAAISMKLDKGSSKYLKVIDNIAQINNDPNNADYYFANDIVYDKTTTGCYKLSGIFPELTYALVDLNVDDLFVNGDFNVLGDAIFGNEVRVKDGITYLTFGENGDVSLKDFLDEKQDTLVSGTNIKTINNTSLLGSGDYEFDSALSEISTNAIQNKVVSKEFAEINYELAVIREELFETILTEIDYQENFAISYTIPDTLADTDGTHRVVFSETQLKTIEFNSVIMNQKMNLANLTFANLTKTTITDGYLYTCNINTSATNIYSIQTPKFTSNHKMLLILDVKSSKTISFTIAEFGSSYKYYSLTANQRRVIYDIQSALGNYNYIFPLGVSGNIAIGDTIEIYNFLFIDLTQMFGAGNEPTTTSDNRIQWLISLGNIAYNTGSLLSTNTTGIQIKDSSDNVLGTISVPETSGKGARNTHDYIEVVEGNIVEGEQLYNLVLHTLVGTRAYQSGDESDSLVITDKTNTNYVLETPTTQIIATDLQFDQISSLIEQGGTINALFTNTPPNITTTFVVKKAIGE